MFQANNITAGYGKKNVIEEVSFSFEKGEVVCVLGPNGVGKSTLFKSILQINEYCGKFTIEGKDLKSMSHKDLAKQISYVPQFCKIPFDYKVEDVMVAGRYAHSRYQGAPKNDDYKIVNDVLKRLKIEHLRKRNINKLSGGQKQMVMIGRALVQEPKMILMDEPSASLDFGRRYEMIHLIKALKETGISIVMTTHSPKIASLCADKILMIKNRKVFRYGPKIEVMKKEYLMDLYELNCVEALEMCVGI